MVHPEGFFMRNAKAGLYKHLEVKNIPAHLNNKI
jgi:hypothetical protein